MKKVKISEVKNNLSRYLRYVRQGGRVRILDRVTPVADLVPIAPAQEGEDGDGDQELLRALARRGVLTLGEAGAIDPALLRPGPGLRGRGRRKRGAGVLGALQEERAGSR